MMMFRYFVVILIVLIFGFGVLDFLTHFEKNGCEMTYMFAQPQYLRIELDTGVQQKFPRYGLYFYGEGQYAETTKRSNFQLSGVPVLFIPGNAGSYRQVRSLASVALRKAEDAKMPFHFNYFSLDFDEELSAFYGQSLYDEAEFTHECIKKILTLYKGSPSVPKSVVLVGHSMGGMVARSLFTLPDFKPQLVNTIITQATPHQSPVISIDPVLAEFYNKVNTFWRKNENTTVSEVTVFSTGGGYRDVLVRSQLTSLNKIVHNDRSLSSNTMSVPGAWVSTDHLCHVWCKQIVLTTQRALFDIVDRSTKQIAVGPFYRMAVFLHHFIKNPGGKKFKGSYDSYITLDKAIKWEIRKKLSWKLWADFLSKQRYSVTEMPPLLIPTEYAIPGYGYVAISNINNDKWLGVCSLVDKSVTPVPAQAKKQSKMLKQCSHVANHAQYAEQLPSPNSDKKVVHISPETLKENTHIVMILPESKRPVEVYSELYKLPERHLEYSTMDIFKFLKKFPQSILDIDIVINKTAPRAIFYNISLIDLDIPLQAYTAHLSTIECTGEPCAFTGAVLKLHIPWTHEHTYTFIRCGQNGSIALKLMSPRPHNAQSPPLLLLYLIPTCTFRLSVTISWSELFGQFIRFYGPHLIGFLVIQILMVLSWQMKVLDERGQADSFTVSHARWAQPWRVVPLATLVRFMFYFSENNFAKKMGLPEDDRIELEASGLWYAALPVLHYLVAYSIIALHAVFLNMVLAGIGRMFGFVFTWFHGNSACTKLVQNLQLIVFVTAFFISHYICGSLGLLLIYITTVIKTLSMYVWARYSTNLTSSKWSSYNVYVSCVMLMMVMCVLNLPSLLAWQININYTLQLLVDPSRTSGMVISVTALVLSLIEFPKYTGEMYGIASALLYMMCIAMTLFTMVSIYRIPVYIYSAFIIITTAATLSYLMEHPTESRLISGEK